MSIKRRSLGIFGYGWVVGLIFRLYQAETLKKEYLHVMPLWLTREFLMGLWLTRRA